MERVTLNQLHHDIRHGAPRAGRLGLSGIVDSHDVGVVELGSGLGFTQQAAPAFSAQRRPFGGQYLDGDITVQHGVTGTVDHAQAAPAEFGLNAIPWLQRVFDVAHAYSIARQLQQGSDG